MRITVEAENPQEFSLLAAAVQLLAAQPVSVEPPPIVTPPPASAAVAVPEEAPEKPSSARALDAARDLVERKGLQAATKLLETFGVKRVSELGTDVHAEFIAQARMLAA